MTALFFLRRATARLIYGVDFGLHYFGFSVSPFVPT